MADIRKINSVLRVLQIVTAVILAGMLARAMRMLFFLMKGESLF